VLRPCCLLTLLQTKASALVQCKGESSALVHMCKVDQGGQAVPHKQSWQTVRVGKKWSACSCMQYVLVGNQSWRAVTICTDVVQLDQQLYADTPCCERTHNNHCCHTHVIRSLH
jgi:hypothetical protein